MNETKSDNSQDAVRVTLGASGYTITAGTSTEIVILIENLSAWDDSFIVNLLGIPSSWIVNSDAQPVWISAGGQEKAVLNILPPAGAGGSNATYSARLHVSGQRTPEKGTELDVLLKILPEEKTKGEILLFVKSKELSAVPGSEVKIQLSISNRSTEAEFLELSVYGVPAGWVSLPSPVITLSGNEEKTVEVILQIPSTADIHAGHYPLKICASSQKDPAIKAEIEVTLGIAAYESQGRIGVMLKSTRYTVAPGGSLTVPLTLLNRGLQADTFRLGIEGIPVSWVSTSTPINPLEPGASKEITLVFSPPLSPSSQAGRHKFQIVVISQDNPDQVIKIDCELTVSAYTQFSAELEPKEVEAGQPISLSVKNEGNIHQEFHLSCTSQKDQLIFEFLQPEGSSQQFKQASTEATAQQDGKAATGSQPGPSANTQSQAPQASVAGRASDPTLLAVAPGESAAFRFSARPRQRPFIGGTASYPYQASVDVERKEALPFSGRVTSRGIIPVWVLPVALILCLLLVFSSGLLRGGNQGNGATQTSAAGTAVSAGATQTIIANQTAAAVAGQQDSDGDGLIDQRETEVQTDPANPDSDGDGLMDGEEVFQTSTNPIVPDTDGDGLGDGDEIRLRTNPLVVDTDGDGSRDGDEVILGTNPSNPDSDGDGLIDGSEIPPCPNPLSPDSDQDGIIDGKDLSPCDSNNPALTSTAANSQPIATQLPATQAPGELPTTPPTQSSLPRFKGMILYESDRDGNPEIYTTDDAGHISRLTNDPATDTQPAWEPGLRRLAFTTNRDGQNEIYLMNADGTNAINLTNNPADDQQPTWSVDGEWIAFSSNRDGNYEIYIIQMSTLEVRNLTNNPGNDSQADWVQSATMDTSGESIVFTSDRDGNLEIYRMKTDGTEAVNLTGNSANDQMARGSLDGVLLTFTTDRDGNQEIYSMDIDGRSQVNLTNNPARDIGPSWSPDDAWIAFTTDRDGNREVYLTNRVGVTELYNLTNHPGTDQVSDWR